jgi:hypothetical protein
MEEPKTPPSFKLLFLMTLILFTLSPMVVSYAQSDTISGTIGSYNFPASSYEVVSHADNMLSPVEVVSEGQAPSSTYTYIADDNGYLSVKFVPTAGSYVFLEVNGEAYGWGATDGFSRQVQAGESIVFKITPPYRQTDYSLTQDDSGEVTFVDTYSWNTTSGIIDYNLTVAATLDVEFSWNPREPARGDSVWFYTSLNTLNLNSLTWFINGVEIDYAQGSAPMRSPSE